MATLWAYRTDHGHGIRAILEGGRVEWQWGADRGWSTLAEIELAAKIHTTPAVAEALRDLLEWAREDMRRAALVRSTRAAIYRREEGATMRDIRACLDADPAYLDALAGHDQHQAHGRWTVDCDPLPLVRPGLSVPRPARGHDRVCEIYLDPRRSDDNCTCGAVAS